MAPARGVNGWDGKLRVDKNMEPVEQDAGQDTEQDEASDAEEAQVNGRITEIEGEELEADEDLLEGVDDDETDIDLNHSRISSIPALRLERFKQVKRLCLRQNQVSQTSFPESWSSSPTLVELDLYDNAISHIKGLDNLTALTSLDLSFNNIKHIKRIEHLTNLTELFFVQNKINRIEGLDTLTKLQNLELGGNRIREIENLDHLSNLTELWLGKNKISELKGLSELQNLKLLSIQSNRISSPSLSHLSSLPNLTDLYISHNAITTLEPLATCTNLLNLDVSNNPIASFSGLATLVNLEELWASNCNIDISFEQVGVELGDMKSLTTVYLEGNPLERRQRTLYRNKLKLALPTVKQIDATFVRLE